MKPALASSFTKLESAYLKKVRLFFRLRAEAAESAGTHGGLTSQAREERVAHFACALTFAGMYSLNPSFFSPARLADKRTLGSGPLRNYPAPEAPFLAVSAC